MDLATPLPAGSSLPAWRARMPLVAAAAITTATALAVLLAVARPQPGDARPAQVALLAVIVGSVLAASWTPLVAGTCCLVAYSAYGWRAFDAAPGVELPLVVAFFVVGLRGGTRALRWLAVPTALVGAGRGAVMGGATPLEAIVTAVVMAFLVSVPLWGGAVVGRLREDARRERDRARRAARLADLERAAGIAQERARIARELHDIVAHRLTAIAVQAHAGEHLARSDGDAAARAFAAVAEQATHGMTEMHGLLGVLRATREPAAPAQEAPAPGFRELPALISAEQAGGADIHAVGVTAEAVAALDATLGDEAGLALYRVVQESLSNARRHAAGARVDVEIVPRADGVDVRIVNAAADDGGDTTGVGVGGGYGVLGMRERVGLCGGTFEAGPVGGGWRVEARLPARGRGGRG